jgi:hypothetical protein
MAPQVSRSNRSAGVCQPNVLTLSVRADQHTIRTANHAGHDARRQFLVMIARPRSFDDYLPYPAGALRVALVPPRIEARRF